MFIEGLALSMSELRRLPIKSATIPRFEHAIFPEHLAIEYGLLENVFKRSSLVRGRKCIILKDG